MALPPERISIKRRRQDEPIDTLILEPGVAPEKKRQFTDFCFQRLRHEQTPTLDREPSTSGARPNTASQQSRDYEAFGIPSVRPTLPGDEVRDYAKYRSALKKQSEENNKITFETAVAPDHSQLSSEPLPNIRRQLDTPARRFHLTRDLSSALKPNLTGGIRRSKINLRPPLATFIEHYGAQIKDGLLYQRPPIDSLVELNSQAAALEGSTLIDKTSVGKRTQIGTFQKPLPSATRRGHSIRDDPTTWDQSSDQLANELAALAFDIDPVDATEPPLVTPNIEHITPPVDELNRSAEGHVAINSDDDFVFETYVRVRRDQNVELLTSHPSTKVGVLVIDDENEDLWEKYVNSDDDDDEWDEEDADSNAEENPRNEYPDEEISTDDEAGYDPYKYRRYASEDETAW